MIRLLSRAVTHHHPAVPIHVRTPTKEIRHSTTLDCHPPHSEISKLFSLATTLYIYIVVVAKSTNNNATFGRKRLIMFPVSVSAPPLISIFHIYSHFLFSFRLETVTQ